MEHAPSIEALKASQRGDRGVTRALLDRISKGATAAGAECEILTLAKSKLLHLPAPGTELADGLAHLSLSYCGLEPPA